MMIGAKFNNHRRNLMAAVGMVHSLERQLKEAKALRNKEVVELASLGGTTREIAKYACISNVTVAIIIRKGL